MSNALNVFMKSNPMVVTEAEIAEGSRRGAKMAAEVNALNAKHRGDHEWRAELEDLTHRLVGMPTVTEAQSRLDNLKASIASQVKSYKDQLDECKKALATKFLTGLDRTHIDQKIADVSDQLASFQRVSDLQLRFAEASLVDATTWNPQRERWQELRKRSSEIAKAIQL